jgi:hypothetical protein
MRTNASGRQHFLTQNDNMHCVVYKCSNRQNSAAKENGISFFFIFPKDVKKRTSWVNAVNRTDWSPHEIFSNFIMFGAFVDGWHSVSDDPVFSRNEKYITDWIYRRLICPLLCQLAINLEKLPEIFVTKILQNKFAVDT